MYFCVRKKWQINEQKKTQTITKRTHSKTDKTQQKMRTFMDFHRASEIDES